MIANLPPFRAQSMAGLANKVLKGVYERVPNHFSADLSQMVRSLLQVAPKNRPTVDQILVTPSIKKIVKGNVLPFDEDIEDLCDESQDLLKTIRCPRNLNMVTASLPAPQYQPLQRSKSLAIESEMRITPDEKEDQK